MALGDNRMDKGKLGINRTLRKNAKAQLKKSLDGNDVSAAETQTLQAEGENAAAAALKGQTVALAQNAAAAGSGSVNESQLQKGISRAADTAAAAKVNVKAKVDAYKEAALSGRRAEAMANAENQRLEDARRRQYTIQGLGTIMTGAQKIMG